MAARRLPSLLAAVLSAGLVLAAPAAHAERVVTKDAVGDAVTITYHQDPESEEEVLAPAPDEKIVDITHTVVQHRPHQMRVTVRFRDLEIVHRSASDWLIAKIRVATPQANYWLGAGISRRPGEMSLFEGRHRHVECRGMDWSLDEQTDRLVASVPRTCLGAPRWVRVGVRVDRAVAAPETAPAERFFDDGHRAGSALWNGVAEGPKVFVG